LVNIADQWTSQHSALVIGSSDGDHDNLDAHADVIWMQVCVVDDCKEALANIGTADADISIREGCCDSVCRRVVARTYDWSLASPDMPNQALDGIRELYPGNIAEVSAEAVSSSPMHEDRCCTSSCRRFTVFL
jgi:hypothetical protein